MLKLNYITPAGIQKLKDELSQLLKVERPKTVETVAWAAGNGDRSENGDYIYGKRRLREIDRRLRHLTQKIEAAEVVDPRSLKSATVVFGATVTLQDEDGEIKKFQIVGEDETDIKLNKISWKSPVAKALMGKKVGDEVLIKKPKSESWVEIIELHFI